MEFAVQTRGGFARMLEVARWADERGLACFAMPDHYMASRTDVGVAAYDNLAMLSALSRETSRIRLAVLVSPITYRHPAVLAKTAVTLDEMSGGRFSLGVGTGWLEREHELFGLPFPASAERWERLEESLAYLRAAFDPGAGYEGRYYTLQAEPIRPLPSDGLEIIVGGTGPRRTPTLAGRFADEYNVYPEPTEQLRARIDIARAAATDAGRDPARLLISSSGLLVVGADEADYRRRLAAAAAALDRTSDELEEAYRKREVPLGTTEQVREGLATMAEAGVERFYIQAVGDEGPADYEEILQLVGG